MNRPASTHVLVLCTLLLTMVGAAGAQVPAAGPLAAARDVVVADLVTDLPATLPDGAVAVLLPEVARTAQVDAGVAAAWPTAVAEAFQSERPGQGLVDRGALTEVLREQKLGDSPFADPESAVEVGKLVAARTLFMTRLNTFQLHRGRVQVDLEARLVDVQTGEILWARAYSRGIFPLWAKVAIGVGLLVAAIAAWSWVGVKRRKNSVTRGSKAKARILVDVEGLARSAQEARHRLQQAGHDEAALAVHRASVELDAALDRVRHALPTGSANRNEARELDASVAEAKRLSTLLGDLRAACDSTGSWPDEGLQLATLLRSGASDVRAAVDAYRRHLTPGAAQ